MCDDLVALHFDKACAPHPALQLRQALQPGQDGDIGILEEILEAGGIHHRNDEAGQLPLVFDADDIFFDEQKPLHLLVGLAILEIEAEAFLRHQTLGAQREGGDQVFMAEIFAHAEHHAVGEAAQAP